MYYKPKNGYHGQFSTDVLIELYFLEKKAGVCVEVGVANGTKGSNTLYFEKLGWKTLCIEPNPVYAKKAAEVRDKVVCCACASKNQKNVPFTVFDIGKNNIMSSLSGLRPDKRLLETHGHLINKQYEIHVELKTLDDILEDASFPPDIDFISIDTEGTELDVLKGISFDKWNIALLVVENNFNDSNIEEYLSACGYKKDTRWKINDFYTKEVK